jgi:hypothetical protein
VAEGARLESVYTGNCIKGSNPFFTAILYPESPALRGFLLSGICISHPVPRGKPQRARAVRISDLSEELSTQGAPAGCIPAASHLAYYAARSNLAIFYKDFRHSPKQ